MSIMLHFITDALTCSRIVTLEPVEVQQSFMHCWVVQYQLAIFDDRVLYVKSLSAK